MNTKYYYILFSLLTIGLSISCKSESEKTLRNKIEIGKFDYDSLVYFEKNIGSKYEGGIQYGIIKTENNEQIKFWFISHHTTKDIGGTLYEFPNGEKEFYSGYHCCEIQFYENGNTGKKFKDIEEFKSFVEEKDGISP